MTPKFNKQKNDGIAWAKWSWSPVTGCLHGCKYCYARDIANHLYAHKFEPHFYPERLAAPKNTKIPKHRINEEGIHNVFVSSMGDLFGAWVPKEWINQVIKTMSDSPEWTYLLLTKNPKRYLEFEWPDCCWLGATADTQSRYDIANEVFMELGPSTDCMYFLSCEPLEEWIHLIDPMFHWLIIGGRSKSSGMPANQPKWEWVESLLLSARQSDISVYFKPNLTVRPREYPEN